GAAPGKAGLSGAGDADDRGRHRLRLLARPLSGDRRSAAGRRLGGARLCEALRQLALGRGAADGARRDPEPDRPAVPGRGGRAPRPGRSAGGMSGMAKAWALALALSAAPVLAVQPDEMLADPALEARAREISRAVRCPVCQGESIDDSNARISRDLRIIIRER